MYLFSKIIMLLMGTSVYSGNRVKRVLNGDRVLGRRGPYDVVRYMVGIGSMHGVKWWTLGFRDTLKYTGLYGTINCGGALLTPAIVQTACHCVAEYDKVGTYREPRINHQWESTKIVYIGINDRFGEPFSMLTRPGVKSQKFFIHRACLQLAISSIIKPSHDFGYIRIDPSWIRGDILVPTTNVKFAPLYKMEELMRIFSKFRNNPPVCLIVGYGAFDDYGHPSDFIRAGWTTLLEDWECLYWSTYNMTDDQIKKYRTWVCSGEFPQHYQEAGPGDSGSPFTCNNAYFGVVSAIIPFMARVPGTQMYVDHRVTQHNALIFAANENSVEYRRAFEDEVKNWNQDTYADIVRDLAPWFAPLQFRDLPQNHPNFGPRPVSRLLCQDTAVESSCHIFIPSMLLVLMLSFVNSD